MGEKIWLQLHLTLALDGGEWSTSHPNHFSNGKRSLLPIEWEAGWAPEPDWTFLENVQLHMATVGNAGKRRN